MAEAVLITGARAAAALDLARDFAAAGYDVHMADCGAARIAKWSRVPTAFHRYASPVKHPRRFREDIARLVQDLRPAAIIPSCEEVFHLAAPALIETVQPILFAPPLPQLRQLHDKHAFALACADGGLSAPESHRITAPEELESFVGESLEWVFKPCFSRFGESALIGPEPRALAALTPSPAAPLLAQRRIRGMEACFYGVARDGNLVAFAAYQSHWRLGGGAGFAFAPLAQDKAGQLRKLAAKLAHSTQITGQFACDAVFDGQGDPWLIECNPRATSGVHLLAGNGGLARAMMSGDPLSAEGPKSAHHLGLAMAVFGLPLAIRTNRVAEWRRTMTEGTDAIARPGDRMPLVGALIDAASFALRGLSQGISTTSATTADIAWDGEDLA